MNPYHFFVSPPAPADLVRQKYSLLKELRQGEAPLGKKIAILGGSTTSELKDYLELFLLACGIRPTFYESNYNRYYEEAVFGSPELDAFQPDAVYLHTTTRNINEFPHLNADRDDMHQLAKKTVSRFARAWDALEERFGCAIIQNNFDPPHFRSLGNLEATVPGGAVRFLKELNSRFADEAMTRPGLILHDIDYLSAQIGLDTWHDANSWHAFKCAPGLLALPKLAHNLASVLRALFGKASKCLVLDLDNTLWGGIIGDDGVDGIKLGNETPQGEAYLAFQQYAKALKKRGVILTVCSKNEEANALEGLNHSDSALPPEEFTLIRANWEPKSHNIDSIAKTINIGLDSLVFMDDNPAEREIVRQQIPAVAVVEPGKDVSCYLRSLDQSGLFELTSLSEEDLARSRYYAENAKRHQTQTNFIDYGEYLDSLEMEAEIANFTSQYFDRITQLTNKTNQFNLTTRRYTMPEISAAAHADDTIAIYGRLKDKFGDNGVVSVVLGKVKDTDVQVDLWLMSCRVFKRDMELAMFDQFVARAHSRGIKTITGTYSPTAKNHLVAELFPQLGFDSNGTQEDGTTVWQYTIPDNYNNQCKHIRIQSDS